MMTPLPTRTACHALALHSDTFYCTTKIIEGQVVEMYDYRLAGYTDFFPDSGENWTELRGLTFVQQPSGTWERHILLQKFFNINQTIDWMYDDVKDKEIVRIQNKEDGSIISFIKFANGKVRAKSKMSFESPQAVMAQEVYDTDPNIRKFVDLCGQKGLFPAFELVSPDNQIVLEYAETQLVLLQIRDTNGRYLPAIDVIAAKYNIPFATPYSPEDYNLTTLLALKETSQDDIEGWVVTFADGQMAKVKTDKYLSLHGLIGPDAFRENLLVQTILDGNIDDVISALVPGTKKDKVIALSEKVQHHFNELVQEFFYLYNLYKHNYHLDRKQFAIENKTHRMFSGFMKAIYDPTESNAEHAARDFILRQCKSLSMAQKYLEELT